LIVSYSLFQSTRPRGARPTADTICARLEKFQSTRPRGARPAPPPPPHAPAPVSIHAPAWGATVIARAPNSAGCSFNPRARVGRDRWQSAMRLKMARFQSTRPRGARHDDVMTDHGLVMFQSTRPRGARLKNQQQQNRVCQVSIHAPAWGATRYRFVKLSSR